MKNIDKKDFSRIYELMSFDRSKTLYEMEENWNNLLNEATVPQGSYVRKEIEDSAKSEGINKTWEEITKEFGSDRKVGDNTMLYNAWVDGNWRPGQPVPQQYQTATYKARASNVVTTTTTTPPNGVQSGNVNQNIPDYGYENVALYGFAYYKQYLSQQSGNTSESQKYGKLAKYFYELSGNKAVDMKSYGIDQKIIDDFITEFATEIKNKNGFYDAVKIGGDAIYNYGSKGVQQLVDVLTNPSKAKNLTGDDDNNGTPSNKVTPEKTNDNQVQDRTFNFDVSDSNSVDASKFFTTFFGK